MCIHMYIYVEVCKQVNHECKLNKRMHISIYIYIYIHMHVSTYIYIHMYIYMYVCMYLHAQMHGWRGMDGYRYACTLPACLICWLIVCLLACLLACWVGCLFGWSVDCPRDPPPFSNHKPWINLHAP